MHRYVKSLTPLLWVIALALFAVRAADAHVHLCLDGQEPRASLHLSDNRANHHADEGSSRKHNDKDVDVDVVGAALAKKESQPEGYLPLVPVIQAILHRIASDWTRFPAADVAQDPAPKLPDLFLPLQRGPPL